MGGKLTAYLQLVRLPNVLTAAADSLAGWLLVGGLISDLRWLPLILASMALYAAGTAFNDVFDLEIDRQERPGRPLPSGRVPVRSAVVLGVLGLVLGVVLTASMVSPVTGVVATVLGLCIFSYDAGMKRTFLGPVSMGSCRGLNLLMGMALASNLGGPAAWMAATTYALFVTGITVISRSETHVGRRVGLVGGLAILDLALLGLAGVAMAHDRFPNAASERPLIPLEGMLVLGLIAVLVNQAASAAIGQPEPRTIQKTVKTGILSLVWINVALVAAVRGIEPAILIAILWPPAFLLARWLYAT